MKIENNFIIRENYSTRDSERYNESNNIEITKNVIKQQNGITQPKQSSIRKLDIRMHNAINAYKKLSQDSVYSDVNFSYDIVKKKTR